MTEPNGVVEIIIGVSLLILWGMAGLVSLWTIIGAMRHWRQERIP